MRISPGREGEEAWKAEQQSIKKHGMWNRLTSGGCKLHRRNGAQSVGRGQKMSLTSEKGPDQTLQGLRVVKSLDFILAQVWINIFSLGLNWIRFKFLKERFCWNKKGKANKYKNTKQTYKGIKMNSSQVPDCSSTSALLILLIDGPSQAFSPRAIQAGTGTAYHTFCPLALPWGQWEFCSF